MVLTHLTNKELIDQLTLRNDLTDIEHELLDRLIRVERALKDFESAMDNRQIVSDDQRVL